MSSLCLWAFIAQIWLGMFIVWGFRHEDRFLVWEKKMMTAIRKAVRK